MKRINRPEIVPSLFFLIAALCSPAFAAIDGPDYIAAGELAVFTSDVPAAWAVVPDTFSKSVVIDSSGKKLVFASPVKGTVTIIASTAAEAGETPNIEVRTFTNGDKSDGGGGDEEDEKEPVDKLIALVKSEYQKIENRDAAEAGRLKLAGVFQTVVDFIDKKTVQTPAGARETFRRYWEYEAARAGKGALDAYRPFITAVSAEIDWSSIETVKTDFMKLVKGLTEAARADQSAPTSETAEKPEEKETPQSGSNCPGGVCPTGNCPNGNCNIRRFYY